jgi:DNA-binding response OmpR family regulator
MLQVSPRVDPAAGHMATPGMGRTCIAVVDDDLRMVHLVRRNLELAGYRVVHATDGLGAIDLVQAEAPDLLILDLSLPVLDGFAALRRLREFSELPVMILSARHDEVDVIRGLDSGADAYVRKPFSPRELLARIQGLLRRAGYAGDQQPDRFSPHA